MNNIKQIINFIKNQKYNEAEKTLKKLILTNKNNEQYYLLLGFTLEKNNKLSLALENYKKSKKIKTDEKILNLLANTYIKLNDYNNAFKELSELLKINNKDPKTLNNYGLILISKKREVESIKYFKKAIKIDKDYMDSKYNLLEILEKTNQKSEFKKLVELETANYPDNKIIKFYKANYLNQINKNKEAIMILNKLEFKNDKINWEYRRLNLLGKINEELKNYKAAFANHKMANNYLINNFYLKKFNDKKYFNKLKNFSNIVDKNENIQKLNKENKISLFFIIGFPRSGTTLLDKILSKNSKIYVLEEQSFVEEMLSGLTDADKINCLNIDTKKLRDKYFLQLNNFKKENKIKQQIIIDKMPLNLVYARAINTIFPESKIIFCQRHPLDVILSCYFQNFLPNDAMINFLDLNRTAKLYSLAMKIFSKYKETLKTNIISIKYEDLVSNIENEINKLCNFLDIKKENSMKEFFTNSSKVRIRTASYNQVNKPIYQTSKFKWVNYKKELIPILPIVKKWINYYGY